MNPSLCRLWPVLLAWSLCAAEPTVPIQQRPTPPAPPAQRIGNTIILLPGQSEGGHLILNAAGEATGVVLDRSCSDAFKQNHKEPGIEWKTEPLPAGWWHGVLESSDNPGYANRDFGITMLTKERSSVKVAANYNVTGKTPRSFEFWIYTSTPADGIRMQPDSDLWFWNKTWTISKITLTQSAPPSLPAEIPVTLELPVNAGGEILLPPGVPGGVWTISGILKENGTARFEGSDGKSGEMSFTTDRWKKNIRRGANFYTAVPLKKISLSKKDLFPSVVLTRDATRTANPLPDDGKLTVTCDPANIITSTLEMIGPGLTGETPAFAPFPAGKKIAVLTTWDDGAPTDIRCEEILLRLGYRPTFFLNRNSTVIDQLMALDVEIGSHSYNHPFLYHIPPERVAEESIAMRKFLEAKLGHPVVSYAYPNGYSPAYDIHGDYVLRGVQQAGYWSGRSTMTAGETVNSIDNPLIWKTDGFFGNSKPLEAAWEKAKTKEGAIFYFWGHSWQIGKTDADWKKFENFVTQFSGHPDAWYASQGSLSVWLWARKNVRLTATHTDSTKVSVQITHPWIHPYLAAQCPLALTVPAGVEKVVWQGKEIPVVSGKVDLPWGEKTTGSPTSP